MDKLRFGTAGIPLSTNPRNTLEGLKQVSALGLGAMELEFVRSVNISKEVAPQVREIASNLKLELTCHGSYFINLNAADEAKVSQSIHRVKEAAERLHECGGKSVAFHSAFLLKTPPEIVFERVKAALKKIVKGLQDKGITDVIIRPETAGKVVQFGGLEELLKMSREVEQVSLCIDYSHLHARSNGKSNSFEEFCKTLEMVEKFQGKEGLHNLHCHVQGVAYSEKGEKNHLNFEESDFNWKPLIKAFKEFKCKGIVICESPNIESDALKMKNEYERI